MLAIIAVIIIVRLSLHYNIVYKVDVSYDNNYSMVVYYTKYIL